MAISPPVHAMLIATSVLEPGGPAGRGSGMSAPAPLTVAVTGPTGTFGFGLMPLLQTDGRIGAVVVVHLAFLIFGPSGVRGCGVDQPREAAS